MRMTPANGAHVLWCDCWWESYFCMVVMPDCKFGYECLTRITQRIPVSIEWYEIQTIQHYHIIR